MARLSGLLLIMLITLVGFQIWQTSRLMQEVRALRRQVAAPASAVAASSEDKAEKAATDRIHKELAETRRYIEKRLNQVYRPEKGSSSR